MNQYVFVVTTSILNDQGNYVPIHGYQQYTVMGDTAQSAATALSASMAQTDAATVEESLPFSDSVAYTITPNPINQIINAL